MGECENKSLGTLCLTAYVRVVPIPDIVIEWAALIPLILHLANPRWDAELVGTVSLLGRLPVRLFPRLGTAPSISRLLKEKAGFLDRLDTSLNVWDVKWGSHFPCANGVASEAIVEAVEVGASETAPTPLPRTKNGRTARRGSFTGTGVAHGIHLAPPLGKEVDRGFRRPQELRIVRCKIGQSGHSTLGKLRQIGRSRLFDALVVFIMLGGIAVLILYGFYGTAACVAVAVVSRITSRFVVFARVPRFLDSNEHDKSGGSKPDGCMLVASHVNALTWNLFVGDRGIVDALLNKPMIEVPETSRLLILWFQLADTLQLLAMTFCAAQRGWDGVALVILMFLDWIIEYSLQSDRQIACDFLVEKNITVETSKHEFKGRMAMIMAIHLCAESENTLWMDGIIAPHPRREVLVESLRQEVIPDALPSYHALDSSHHRWVDNNHKWSLDAKAAIHRSYFGTQDV